MAKEPKREYTLARTICALVSLVHVLVIRELLLVIGDGWPTVIKKWSCNIKTQYLVMRT